MIIYKNKPPVNTTTSVQIYIITITKGNETFNKVGYSTDSATRFDRYPKGLHGSTITYNAVYDFSNANWLNGEALEKHIHKMLKQAGIHYTPTFHFAGDSECYKDTLEYIERKTEEYIYAYIAAHAPTEWINGN